MIWFMALVLLSNCAFYGIIAYMCLDDINEEKEGKTPIITFWAMLFGVCLNLAVLILV